MSTYHQLNGFLVDMFNRILKIEEQALATGLEENISVTEIHIIEKIGNTAYVKMSDLAKGLGVTLATLTVACDKLESKEMIVKTRDEKDKRIIRLSLSPKGLAAKSFHDGFHENMARAMLEGLGEEEQLVIGKGIEKLQDFFQNEAEKTLNTKK